MTWIKLKRGNDWATHYLNITCTNQMSKGALRCVAGEIVDVRFPDGTEQSLPVLFEKIEDTEYDHGRETKKTSAVPAVVVSAYGLTFRATLDRVEVLESWAREHGAK